MCNQSDPLLLGSIEFNNSAFVNRKLTWSCQCNLFRTLKMLALNQLITFRKLRNSCYWAHKILVLITDVKKKEIETYGVPLIFSLSWNLKKKSNLLKTFHLLGRKAKVDTTWLKIYKKFWNLVNLLKCFEKLILLNNFNKNFICHRKL